MYSIIMGILLIAYGIAGIVPGDMVAWLGEPSGYTGLGFIVAGLAVIVVVRELELYS